MLILHVTKWKEWDLSDPYSAVFESSGGTIGRDRENLLVLPDSYERNVAPRHAQVLKAVDDSFSLIPEENTTITINDQTYSSTEHITLKHGDIVGIGRFRVNCELVSHEGLVKALISGLDLSQDQLPLTLSAELMTHIGKLLRGFADGVAWQMQMRKKAEELLRKDNFENSSTPLMSGWKGGQLWKHMLSGSPRELRQVLNEQKSDFNLLVMYQLWVQECVTQSIQITQNQFKSQYEDSPDVNLIIQQASDLAFKKVNEELTRASIAIAQITNGNAKE